jgi:hypothetical protein
MTVESRRDGYVFSNLQEDTDDEIDDGEPTVNLFAYGAEGDEGLDDDVNVAAALALRVAALSQSMKDEDLHSKLQSDIMEHNWTLRKRNR